MNRVDFVSKLHKRTQRDYLQRVVEHDKAACPRKGKRLLSTPSRSTNKATLGVTGSNPCCGSLANAVDRLKLAARPSLNLPYHSFRRANLLVAPISTAGPSGRS